MAEFNGKKRNGSSEDGILSYRLGVYSKFVLESPVETAYFALIIHHCISYNGSFPRLA
jgi:hypothetical protein